MDKARHVGEAVVMVVAATRAQALDAAEAIEVEYDELPFVTSTEDALVLGTPALWNEAPDNVLVDTQFGDKAKTDDAFASATHIVKMEFNIGRVTAIPMELRSCLAHYDAATGRYTLYAGSGGAVKQKQELASVLGIAPANLRVLSYDVGGNFGSRNRPYVEFGLVLWASKKLGRAVKYTATRSEA
jgi:carbon-monoxide dehydrogenase large subunit